MSSSDKDERLLSELTEGIRALRERERRGHRVDEGPGPKTRREPASPASPLDALPSPAAPGEPARPSPDRDTLNASWDVATALTEPPRGWGRLVSVFRAPLQRLVRFALGPLVEKQVRMNAAQVQFDNEIVRYLDERLDRVSRHYDGIVGLHGRRMEEIDERHLILQQELIRHVHDLVERIEFVFESAEQNHLYLEGMLRETREEIESLRKRWEQLLPSKR